MKYILKKDYQLIIQPKKIIIAMMLSIVVFLSFSFIFKDYMEETKLIDQVNIGIVDEEQSFLTGMLIDNFQQNDAFSGLFQITVASEEVLMNQYNDNQLSAIVYLPESFTDSLYRFENIPLTMKLNPNFPLKNVVLENIMGSYSTYIKAVDVGIYSLYTSLKEAGVPASELTQINETFSMNMVLTALNRNVLFELTPVHTYPSAVSTSYFIFSIMILVIVFMASSGSHLYLEEIENDSLARYLCTGGSVIQFSISKVCILSLNIFLTLMPLFIILIGLIPKMTALSILLVICLYIATILLFSSLSLLLGLCFYKHKVNALFSTMLTLFLGIIGGQFFPIQIMPKFLQDIASITPNYWILKLSLFLSQNQITFSYVLTITCLIIGTLLLNLSQLFIICRSYLWEK